MNTGLKVILQTTPQIKDICGQHISFAIRTKTSIFIES